MAKLVDYSHFLICTSCGVRVRTTAGVILPHKKADKRTPCSFGGAVAREHTRPMTDAEVSAAHEAARTADLPT